MLLRWILPTFIYVFISWAKFRHFFLTKYSILFHLLYPVVLVEFTNQPLPRRKTLPVVILTKSSTREVFRSPIYAHERAFLRKVVGKGEFTKVRWQRTSFWGRWDLFAFRIRRIVSTRRPGRFDKVATKPQSPKTLLTVRNRDARVHRPWGLFQTCDFVDARKYHRWRGLDSTYPSLINFLPLWLNGGYIDFWGKILSVHDNFKYII